MAATSAAPRKAPAKKKTAPAPRRTVQAVAPAAPEDGEARASVVLDPDRKAAPVEVFPIFAIGDTQYYAPTRPRAAVELKYLYLLRHEGEESAAAFLLEELVGHDGYVALMEYEALTAEDLDRIMSALREAVLGAATGAPKGGLRIT